MGIRTDYSDVPLAIIGMGCRLPQAEDLDQYWELISNGRSAIAEVPADRLDRELYFHPDKGVRGKTYSQMAGLLPEGPLDFTRYPIPESMRDTSDPMHLMMTAVAADALRHGGLDPFALAKKNAAVFIGHAVGSDLLRKLTYAAHFDDAMALLDNVPDFQQLAPQVRRTFVDECQRRMLHGLREIPLDGRNYQCNMVAGTVAKAFGLTGPWLALNSACASSLHAMLMGARALQQGRVDMVIAGGASHCTAHTLVLFSAAQAMSATGSRPFDADADGLIMSEGYVAVVMKTLEKALADGDPIQAVVRGLGVATDGRGKSLWAPRKEGQIKAMQRAYRSGVDMAGLQYLECHATATQLGDATELETLGEVLGPKMPPGKQIAITSVKANIGHALEAAGVAGLIKTVLCMQHETIPPAINIEKLNPKIDWNSAPYYIPQTAGPWTAPTDGQPRRAAVNAFGIGGLNMHVVLDQFSQGYHRQLLAAPRPTQHASGGNGSANGQNGSARGGVPATADDKSIAIIGMGCIFPGAEGIDKFWETLSSGSDPKTAPSEPRWTKINMAEAAGRPFVGGFITDFEYNWRKHKVPPKQVAEADPLQFMFLEAAEQALADAGYDKKPLDRERCGVMVGTEFGGEFSDHLEMGLRLPEFAQVFAELLSRRGVPADKIAAINKNFADTLVRKWPSLVDETGSFTTSTLASRISKTLDLAGGAVAVDSGSTSALAGLSICVDMLLSGDNDVMVCAAGQRRMGLNAFRALQAAGTLASGDTPRSVLDAGYDGVVPGEGVGVVILKRLADARRDGDHIHAILRGIGVAHHESNAEGLRLAVERSSAMAGIAPGEVSVAEIETDEQLAVDGAELNALAELHATPGRRAPLTFASGTVQFGHLGGASGMAALIKASLEIEHGETAPTAGLVQPATALGAWQHAVTAIPGSTKLSGRRLVGISCWSRGLACHLILEHGAAVAQQPALAKAQPVVAKVQAGRPALAPRMQVTMVESALHGNGDAVHGNGHGNGNGNGNRNGNGSPSHGRIPAHATSAPAMAPQAVATHAAASRPTQTGSPRSARFAPTTRPAVPNVSHSNNSVALEWQIRRLCGGTSAELVGAIDKALADPAAAWQSDRRFTPADRFRLAIVADSEQSLADKLRLARPQLENLAARNVLEQQGIFHRQLPQARPRVALVFPGQGSQYSGMLRTLVENNPAAARSLGETDAVMRRLGHPTFAELAWSASDRLGADVWTTQVSMLLADSLVLSALADRGIAADVVLGHSYGEFVALYAAGAWDFETAVRMTQARCQGIEAAVAGGETGMLATDATAELIEQLSAAGGLDLYVANLNAPDQCVVGGTRAHLEQLATALSSHGRQARILAVPGAFHTPLLSTASRPLEEALRTAAIAAPQVKFVSTVNNSVIGDPAEIRRNLARQLTTPVRYAQLISRLAAETPTVFVEVGPGQTLTRLNRRILGSGADVIASDNAKRPGWEPLLGVQALLECLGACGSGASHETSAADHSTPKPAAPTTTTPAPKAVAPAKAAAAAAPQQPTMSAALTGTKGTTALSDQSSTYDNIIPHFDATERRRDKMRAAGGPAGAAKPAATTPKVAAPVAKPATPVAKAPPPAARQVAPAVKQTAAPAAKLTASAAKLAAPVAAKPAPVARPTPVAPQHTYPANGNGSTNGSNGHHPPRAAAAPVTARPQPAAAPAQPSKNGSPGNSVAELEAFLINFVVEQTGYPAEVVDLDADLEADLGIDSIKKAQLFGELQEYFDVSALVAGNAAEAGNASGNFSLDDFTTLRHVLNFLAQASTGVSGQAASNGHHTADAPAPFVAPPAAAAPALAQRAVAPQPTVVPQATAAPQAAPAANATELEAFLINFVVEQTGYPAEVVDLDADLEADLGIDSIKKAQLFGELQEYFDVSALVANAATEPAGTTGGNFSLDDFTTLRHVLNFLLSASPAAPTPAAVAPPAPQPPPAPVIQREAAPQPIAATPQPASPAANSAELEAFLINFVVEQTGYPAEVVDLDADLEADLGIDSIKKAQLFGELQEYFDVSALVAGNTAEGSAGGNLSLDDFTTLRHVLNFLVQSQSGAASASAGQPLATTDPVPAVATLYTQPAPAPVRETADEINDAPAVATAAAASVDGAQRAAELEAFLINFVVEQTGYPAEVVDLDADLEADLGIDSIKKAQLFGELQEYFDVSALVAGATADAAGTTGGNFSLDDFTTLRHVLEFLLKADVDSSTAATPRAAAEPEQGSSAPLEGTPYELGWQHGKLLKDEIRRILRHYADCVDEQFEELPGAALRTAPERLLSADELDELQGLADAVEVPLGNMLAHQLALMSNLGSGAGQAVAQPGVHALRQPAPLTGALRAAAQGVVFARHPHGEIAHLATTYVGSVALLGGINAAGIAVTAYPLAKQSRPPGEPVGFSSTGGVASSTIVRTLLGSAATLAGATELANSLSLADGAAWAALVSQSGSGEAVALEFDGQKLQVRPVTQGVTLGQFDLPASLDAGSLADQLAAGPSPGPGTVASERKLSPAAGAESLAVVIEPAVGNLWMGGSAAEGSSAQCWSIGQSLPAWDGLIPAAPPVVRAGHDSSPVALTQPVTSRMVMEMRESPLPPHTPTEPVFTGQAIMLGTGATSEALCNRLAQAGVAVHVLSPAAEPAAVLAELEEICRSGPAPHLFLTTACDAPPIDPYHLNAWEEKYHSTMLLPFLLCQKWTELAVAGGWLDRATIVATTAQGGDFGFSRGAEAAQGGALAGMLKAIFVEYLIMGAAKDLRVKVVDAPLDACPAELADNVFRELASGSLAYEVAYVAGRRLVPFAFERNLADSSGAPKPGVVTRPGSGIRHGSTWVITGGARGITAVAALELGKRFGLNLHLVGSTPLAEIDPAWRDLSPEALQKLKASVMIAARKAGKPTAQAWQRVEKDLEIDRTLRDFADAGVAVTYHACDVSNRSALGAVLDQIRATDGPIAGILHGAGVEKSCRFERKQLDVVVSTIRVKVDGTANLMVLTRRDPIRHFIVFGSISGRLGGFGQVDYSLANEMACKLLGSYRRSRPWVQAVGFHWHAWDGVGMAARPETKSLLQSNGALALMPLAEGLAHLIREMAAGTPEPEVMITERHHWERFAAGLGTLAAEVRGSESAAEGAAPTPYPLLGNPQRGEQGASGEVTFYPAVDRFLLEHRLRGKPLLPAVVGLEALAEAARAASGQAVVGFRNVDMVDGLTFHGDRPAVAQASATIRPDGLFDCRLTADFHNRGGGLIQAGRLYLEATAETGTTSLPRLEPIPATEGEWSEFAYPEEAPIHHGPIFRGLTAGCCNERCGTARIVALPQAELAGEARVAGWAIPSSVLDAAFYACGTHLWVFGGNAVALPRRVADLRLGRMPRDGEQCLVHLVCIDTEAGDYDFDVVGEDGALIVQARRFGQVIFARGYYGPPAQQ